MKTIARESIELSSLVVTGAVAIGLPGRCCNHYTPSVWEKGGLWIRGSDRLSTYAHRIRFQHACWPLNHFPLEAGLEAEWRSEPDLAGAPRMHYPSDARALMSWARPLRRWIGRTIIAHPSTSESR